MVMTASTSFDAVIRLYGSQPVSAKHQQLFANAVARVRGIDAGELLAVNGANSGLDLNEVCGVRGQPPLNEMIADVMSLSAPSACPHDVAPGSG